MTEPLEYATKHDGSPRRPVRTWIKVLIVVVLLTLAVFALWPRPRLGLGHPGWGKCFSNLKQIGQAILLYSNEYGDSMPPDFAALIPTEEMVPEVFVCNSTDDTKSAATQPAYLRSDFANGGHCSYVYLPSDTPVSKLTATDVVAFEPPEHHDGRANVLFGDGHVERLSKQASADLMLQFKLATTRPVRLTVK